MVEAGVDINFCLALPPLTAADTPRVSTGSSVGRGYQSKVAAWSPEARSLLATLFKCVDEVFVLLVQRVAD